MIIKKSPAEIDKMAAAGDILIRTLALLEGKVRAGPLARDLSFPYHPHVTVAHDVGDEMLDRAFAALASYDASFRVWGFTLFEQGPDKVWRPQRDFPFGRAGLLGPPEPGDAPASSG